MKVLDEGGLSYFWGKIKDRFEDLDTRTASDIPTNITDVSVQDALDSLASGGGIGDITADDIIFGEDGETVASVLEEHSAAIVDLEANVGENTAEIASLYPEIAIITLPADAWTQNGDILEQVASHEIFAEYGYLYDPAPISAQILTVVDLGGIVMDDAISDGSAIFQCPRMPDVDIDMRIVRNVQKEEG